MTEHLFWESVWFLSLEHGSAKYSLQAKSSALPVFANKVLSEHSHSHSFIVCCWFLLQSRVEVVTRTIWPTKSNIFILWPLVGKSLPTNPDLEHYSFGGNRFIHWSFSFIVEQIITHPQDLCTLYWPRRGVPGTVFSLFNNCGSRWYNHAILQMVQRRLEIGWVTFPKSFSHKSQNQGCCLQILCCQLYCLTMWLTLLLNLPLLSGLHEKGKKRLRLRIHLKKKKKNSLVETLAI